MPVTVVPSQSDIATALRAFLVEILASSVAVVRGQDNRVPEPQGSDYVVVTPILRNRISTNVDVYVDGALASPQVPASTTSRQSTQVTVQLDVHGPNSSDNAQIISTLLRSSLSPDVFKASGFDVTPLYADDPKQTPFVNAEGQYEYRWTVDAVVQANQVVTTQIPATAPQFATQISISSQSP